MRGTRWKKTLRECAALVHRELRIALTPSTHPRKWIFVVGCYNSGTTLLSSLLGAHSEIAALPDEGQFLTDEFLSDYEVGLPRMWVLREDLFRLTDADVGPDVVRLKKEWLMRLDRSAPFFLEKSPPNAARTLWLQKHFCNAHFIAIVRNGYAVSEGIRRKAQPQHLQKGWPISLCARQWNRSNEILVEDASAIEHLLWVRYEDLATDPVAVLDRVWEFVGVEADSESVKVGARWPVHERREPILNLNPESMARLSPADVSTITDAAEPMLENFGYEIL